MTDFTVTLYGILGQLIEDLRFEGVSTTRDVLIDLVFAVAKRALADGEMLEATCMDSKGRYAVACHRSGRELVLRILAPGYAETAELKRKI